MEQADPLEKEEGHVPGCGHKMDASLSDTDKSEPSQNVHRDLFLPRRSQVSASLALCKQRMYAVFGFIMRAAFRTKIMAKLLAVETIVDSFVPSGVPFESVQDVVSRRWR